MNISRSAAARSRRLLLGAFVALLALAVAPQPASARMGGLVFINNSNLCAYVTIYHSEGGEHPIWQVASGTLQPRFVKAGANFAGSVDWSDVKVRAQVNRNTYCTGEHIVDVEAVYHDTSTVRHVQRTATLQSDSRFYITIR
ncbi:MAG TPA: hypothetical protein VIJ12_08605 [Candidatus Baltobacteraceae bacterium]